MRRPAGKVSLEEVVRLHASLQKPSKQRLQGVRRVVDSAEQYRLIQDRQSSIHKPPDRLVEKRSHLSGVIDLRDNPGRAAPGEAVDEAVGDAARLHHRDSRGNPNDVVLPHRPQRRDDVTQMCIPQHEGIATGQENLLNRGMRTQV